MKSKRHLFSETLPHVPPRDFSKQINELAERAGLTAVQHTESSHREKNVRGRVQVEMKIGWNKISLNAASLANLISDQRTTYS